MLHFALRFGQLLLRDTNFSAWLSGRLAGGPSQWHLQLEHVRVGGRGLEFGLHPRLPALTPSAVLLL